MVPASLAAAPAPAARQRGGGLLELLISLALLATALLGSASAVLQSQQAAAQAVLQTQAAELLAELAEWQLADPQGTAPDMTSATWQQLVARTLPQGRGEVEESTSPQATRSAVVAWVDASTGAALRLQMPLPVVAVSR